LRWIFACTSAKHCIFEVTYSITQNNVFSILTGNRYKWSYLDKSRGTTGHLEKRILVLDLWCQNYYCFQLAPIIYGKMYYEKNPTVHGTGVKERRIK